MTFADVLELWPFTLDELVQAFHDYVSFLEDLYFSYLAKILESLICRAFILHVSS